MNEWPRDTREWDGQVLAAVEQLLLSRRDSSEELDKWMRTEGFSKSASSFFIRFLKNKETMEKAGRILQLLNPVEVLCGSAVPRRFAYICRGEEISIRIGDQDEVGLGYKVWGCAEAMLRYLEDGRVKVEGRHVMELGAGLGLLSICAAVAGALTVVATDYLPKLLEVCECNMRENRVEGCLMTTALVDWKAPPLNVVVGKEDVVILATDVVYEESHVHLLLGCLKVYFDDMRVTEAWLTLRSHRPGVAEFVRRVLSEGCRWSASIQEEDVEGIVLVHLIK